MHLFLLTSWYYKADHALRLYLQGVNRALGKPATMSSLYQGNFDYAPEKGVDGVLSSLNMFHTDHEFGAWFEVDLVDPIHVKQIVLINRQDWPDGWGRLSNADVTLIDTKGEVHDHKNVGDTTGVSEIVLNFNTIMRSILPPKELEPVRLNTSPLYLYSAP